MISVCIPVYNVDIRHLVARLHEMGVKSEIPFEIIVIDDASSDTAMQNQNTEIKTAGNIRYKTLSKNIGRNLIRFELATMALYDHLLFLDADSGFNDTFFFRRYIHADWRNQLIIGGRMYSEKKPQREHILHWKYGKSREERSVESRNLHPYQSFLACNFLISKKNLFSLVIDQNLKGYCHEDTFMGMQFEKNRIPVQHINNPVIHLGLDTTDQFLNKQEEALYHLNYIYKTYNDILPVVKQVRLLQAFEKLRHTGTLKMYNDAIFLIRKIILKNLSSLQPSLIFLDMHKLGIFIEKYSRN